MAVTSTIENPALARAQTRSVSWRRLTRSDRLWAPPFATPYILVFAAFVIYRRRQRSVEEFHPTGQSQPIFEGDPRPVPSRNDVAHQIRHLLARSLQPAPAGRGRHRPR